MHYKIFILFGIDLVIFYDDSKLFCSKVYKFIDSSSTDSSVVLSNICSTINNAIDGTSHGVNIQKMLSSFGCLDMFDCTEYHLEEL